VYSQQ